MSQSDLFVHCSSDEVSIGPIVTGVESGVPLTIPVGGGTASNLDDNKVFIRTLKRSDPSHLVSRGPDHLGVVPGGGAEGEGLDVLVPEERHLVIPVSHCGSPVVGWSLQRLLVDVEILTNSEPDN